MSKTIKFVIKIDRHKIRRGHTQHTTGTGTHGDKRLKRLHTRGNRNRAAIREYS